MQFNKYVIPAHVDTWNGCIKYNECFNPCQVSLVPKNEANTLVTSHATKADTGYLVELAKEVKTFF